MVKIKKALDNVGIALLAAKRDLEKAKIDTIGSRNKKVDFELRIDGYISQEREKEKNNILRTCALEIETDLAEAEAELSELRVERAAQLEHYSYDNIKQGTIANSPVGQETQLLLQELRQEAYDTVSPRFVDTYFKTLGKCRVSEEDFLDALDHLEEARDNFYSQRDNRFNMILESLIEKVTSRNMGEAGDEGNISGTVIGIGVVAGALSLIVFPIYCVLCALTYIFNLKKSFLMKKSLDLLKVVNDNFALMEKAVETRGYLEYEKKKEEIEAEFSKAINMVQKEVDRIKNQISEARQQAIAEFVFDETPAREQLKEDLQNIERAIAENEKAERQAEAKIEKLNAEMKELKLQYENEIKAMIGKYINFDSVGEDKIFPERFLLTDSEPLKFFDKGRASNFFVYNEAPMAIDFIKLICLQSRTRMVPNTVFTQVWDTTSSGFQLTALTNPDSSKSSNLFTIVNTTSEVKNEVESLAAILRKRLQEILYKGQDINQYNEAMIKRKSMTEPYHHIIVLSPEVILTNEDVKRLLVNGPSIGIYLYLFADILKLSEQYFPVIENVEYTHMIRNGNVMPGAQRSLIDQIKNAKKN